MKTCLYFIDGLAPTVTEQGFIDRLAQKYNVHVRTIGQSSMYGPRLEAADAVAGSVPAAYTTAIADYADGNVSPALVAKPEAALVLPGATPTFAHTGTLQLRAVAAELDETTRAITLTDRTSGAGIAWGTSDAAKATVDANGLVTGVAAGSAVITWTYTYSGILTMTATRTVTLS